MQITKDSLIALGLLAAFIVAATVFVYLPQGRKLKDVETRGARLRQELAADAQKASLVPEMIRRVGQMKCRYKDFHRRLPDKKELGGFLSEISGNLANEDLSNQFTKTGSPSREELFHTLPIAMRFQGSYLATAGFLKRIRNMERLTRVRSLTVEKDGEKGMLNIELEMNIYFTES